MVQLSVEFLFSTNKLLAKKTFVFTIQLLDEGGDTMRKYYDEKEFKMKKNKLFKENTTYIFIRNLIV